MTNVSEDVRGANLIRAPFPAAATLMTRSACVLLGVQTITACTFGSATRRRSLVDPPLGVASQRTIQNVLDGRRH